MKRRIAASSVAAAVILSQFSFASGKKMLRMVKERKLTIGYFFCIVVAVLLVNPFNTRASEQDQYSVEYFDADTNEIIYSEIKSMDEVSSSNFVYEPPYMFQNEVGENYTLDTENPKNRFVISIELYLIESWPEYKTGYESFRVYYKKGVLEEGKTAVKIRMLTKEEQVKVVDVRYVDQLLVGEPFVYEPDSKVETKRDGTLGRYYVFDSNDAENQLEINQLSENVEENVLNVYYQVKSYETLARTTCKYWDIATGELLKDFLIARRGGEYFELEPEALFTAEDGTVYVFDKADVRNVLNTGQFIPEVQDHFECYYRQQIKIRFDAGDGKCAVDTGTFLRGLSIGTLPIPTRTGYLFTGWYTSKAGGIQIKDGTVVDFDKDQTLYAGWMKQNEISNTDGEKDGGQQLANLKRVVISKASAKKNGRLQLKWKKISNASGYEICYAQNENFKKATQKETKQCGLTLKKLKKGSTYYVKVRAYQYDSTGQKIYGKYSKKKKIKIR